MSAAAAARQISTMYFDVECQSAVHVTKEERSSVKAGKWDRSASFSSQTPGKGTRDSPIVVASFQNGQQGSKDEPICIEDAEVIGDHDHPISVDDHEGEAEEALVQSAIEESLMDLESIECFEVDLDDPKGKKPKSECRSKRVQLVQEDGESSNPSAAKEALVQSTIKESLMDLESIECFEVDPDDPKGKKPKIERRSKRLQSIQEVGESSNPPAAEPDAYCSICMESKFKYECFSLKNCSHAYCSSCVGQYVEAKVEENVISIGCPDPSCKDGYLEPDMCQSILKPEIFDRWGTALCEAMIGSMKFYCPFKDCSALLINEVVESGGEFIRQSECPHCFRLFCAHCKVPWHPDMSCEEFTKLGADEREREDIMLRIMAKDNQWQRCPSCKFYVEKISGCMFIACRCGYRFCYGCGTQMNIDHFCMKCGR